jgi:hypothetical protein
MSKALSTTGIAAALCAPLLVTASSARAELCYDDAVGKGRFYGGPSASIVYDATFKKTNVRLRHLEKAVPQGAATWSNWEGQRDLLLFTAERGNDNAYIMGIDAKTGKHVGTAKIKSDHAGGIAVFERLGWAFVSGVRRNGQDTVVRFSLKKLKRAIKNNAPIKPETETAVAIGASFLTSHGPTDTLWVGAFDDDSLGAMEAYKVRADGEIDPLGEPWEVPKKTQGLVVTRNLFVFSTSLGNDNRSNIYVVRRGKGERELSRKRLFCFRAPSMAEGMAVYGNDVFLIFESAAAKYRKKNPRNVIASAHKAPLTGLDRLVPR